MVLNFLGQLVWTLHRRDSCLPALGRRASRGRLARVVHRPHCERRKGAVDRLGVNYPVLMAGRVAGQYDISLAPNDHHRGQKTDG